jgi:hypothetical protein
MRTVVAPRGSPTVSSVFGSRSRRALKLFQSVVSIIRVNNIEGYSLALIQLS